jgi:hypothetical protein
MAQDQRAALAEMPLPTGGGAPPPGPAGRCGSSSITAAIEKALGAR